jgi:hypothetical protein
MDKYRLDGKRAVPVADMVEWSRAFETMDRRVALTHVGGVRVSTVFLALDHGWGDGPPILFESMVFADDESHEDIEMRRYSTWEEAEEGHAELVAKYEAVARSAEWHG